MFNRFGSLSGISFRNANERMLSYSDVQTQLYDVYRDVHMAMRQRGYLLAPSLEEPVFLNASHTPNDIKGMAQNLAACIALSLEKNHKDLLLMPMAI